MIHVVARASIRPEMLDDYLKIVRALLPTVRAEDGCLRYEPCLDYAEDGSRAPFVTMLESWESKAHLDAHLASAHMKAFVAQVTPLRLGKSELRILTSAEN